jgi:hypothetical protein
MPRPVRLETENVGFSSELVPERRRQFVETVGRNVDIAIFLQERSTELFVDEAVERLISVLFPRRRCRHVRFCQSLRELIGSPRFAFVRIGYESAATVTAAVIRACRIRCRSVVHRGTFSLCSNTPTPAPRVGNLYSLGSVSRMHEALGALLLCPAKEQTPWTPLYVFHDEVRAGRRATR